MTPGQVGQVDITILIASFGTFLVTVIGAYVTAKITIGRAKAEQAKANEEIRLKLDESVRTNKITDALLEQLKGTDRLIISMDNNTVANNKLFDEVRENKQITEKLDITVADFKTSRIEFIDALGLTVKDATNSLKTEVASMEEKSKKLADSILESLQNLIENVTTLKGEVQILSGVVVKADDIAVMKELIAQVNSKIEVIEAKILETQAMFAPLMALTKQGTDGTIEKESDPNVAKSTP